MFFRLPTGVFTLYVKRLFSFFLFQYSFQLCNDFGMFGRQILLFSDVLLQVVKLAMEAYRSICDTNASETPGFT